MLLSLASIPLTAGFLGEFYLVAAGVSGSLWALVIILVVTSAIGIFYYLRIVVALYSRTPQPAGNWPSRIDSHSLSWTLGVLTAAVILIGCYPSPVMRLIQTMIAGSG
jgi:NADH-quinone oxidoreductase subunit N